MEGALVFSDSPVPDGHRYFVIKSINSNTYTLVTSRSGRERDIDKDDMDEHITTVLLAAVRTKHDSQATVLQKRFNN